MSDAGASTTIPPFASRLLHDFAQKALTTAATALLAHGVLTQTQITEFTEVGSALILYAAGCLWTVGAAYIRQLREHALASNP